MSTPSQPLAGRSLSADDSPAPRTRATSQESPGVVIEAKNTNRLELAAALDEALAERDNASAAYGVAWIKRKGRTSAKEGYVVMDGAQFMSLLKEAGY